MLTVAILSVGCEDNRYQITTNPDGTAYRLDTQSGEVKLIDGKELHAVGPPGSPRGPSTQGSDYSVPRMWPADTTAYVSFLWPARYDPYIIPQIDSLEVRMVSSWRNGHMFYRFHVSPYSDAVSVARDKATAKLNVDLHDGSGFELFSIDFYLTEMTKLVDSDGTAIALAKSGKVKCERELYKDFSSMTVGWNF